MNPFAAHSVAITLSFLIGIGSLHGQVTLTRASVSSTGAQANTAAPSQPAMATNSDGSVVVFISAASNLVPGDTNGVDDVFVRDVTTGVTERVSVSSAGVQMLPDKSGRGCNAAAISGDGRYVVFATPGKNLISGENYSGGRGDIYLRDRQAATTVRISRSTSGGTPNGDSWVPSISRDGRYVAFYSYASNLVANDRNRTADVFLRDLQAQTTSRLSVTPTGGEANNFSMLRGNESLSDDGRFVVFISAASNLVPGDTNGTGDLFVRDLQSGSTVRVNLTPSGGQSTGGAPLSLSISGDGRYVAWLSAAADLLPSNAPRTQSNALYSQALRHDRWTGVTDVISRAPNGDLADRGIAAGGIGSSADGRVVSFVSASTNLVAGFPGTTGAVFLRDTQSGSVALVDTALGGGWANASPYTFQSVVSADGTTVVFGSGATNLVAGDTNGVSDVFVVR